MNRKPVVDYRQFRLNKLNTPEFAHLKLLGGWLVYFALYFLTENLIPAAKCHVIYCALDDLFPFCEWFVIPYFLWYLFVAGSLLYFALYHIDSFKKLSKYIMVTQFVAMAIYILYPNRQDLRPDTFANDNLLTRLIGLLYTFDTSTNVCPSLHVAYSLGIASVWLKEEDVKWFWKAAAAAFAALVCVSVFFVKQHSVVDFFVALPVCALAEWLVFHKKI